ncbi:hypothetical protein LUX05_05745 [Streptomyces somaliensis]|nr:hypothetical protein [Streptomyces sp. MRC013]MCP9961007.1 hypothetical protein [Streptomyces somaliensis]URM91536.1 hypothetical protein LUW75_17880 [Streptomyces sp. MRC013]
MNARRRDGCTVNPHTSIVERYVTANRTRATGRPTSDQNTRGARTLA